MYVADALRDRVAGARIVAGMDSCVEEAAAAEVVAPAPAGHVWHSGLNPQRSAMDNMAYETKLSPIANPASWKPR